MTWRWIWIAHSPLNDTTIGQNSDVELPAKRINVKNYEYDNKSTSHRKRAENLTTIMSNTRHKSTQWLTIHPNENRHVKNMSQIKISTNYTHWCARDSNWNQKLRPHCQSISSPSSKSPLTPINNLCFSELFSATEFEPELDPQHWWTQTDCPLTHRNKKPLVARFWNFLIHIYICSQSITIKSSCVFPPSSFWNILLSLPLILTWMIGTLIMSFYLIHAPGSHRHIQTTNHGETLVPVVQRIFGSRCKQFDRYNSLQHLLREYPTPFITATTRKWIWPALSRQLAWTRNFRLLFHLLEFFLLNWHSERDIFRINSLTNIDSLRRTTFIDWRWKQSKTSFTTRQLS